MYFNLWLPFLKFLGYEKGVRPKIPYFVNSPGTFSHFRTVPGLAASISHRINSEIHLSQSFGKPYFDDGLPGNTKTFRFFIQ